MIRPSESLVGTQLNSVWLEGKLVADPVDLALEGGWCRFRVEATQNREPVSTFLVEAAESALDGCRSRLGRGQGVRIIGRLHQHQWTDPTGRTRKEVAIISELVEPLGLPL